MVRIPIAAKRNCLTQQPRDSGNRRWRGNQKKDKRGEQQKHSYESFGPALTFPGLHTTLHHRPVEILESPYFPSPTERRYPEPSSSSFRVNILASCGGSPRASWPEVQEYWRETLTRGAAYHSKQDYCACWDGVTTKWTRLGKGFKLRGGRIKT
jgi:hypothetical protein